MYVFLHSTTQRFQQQQTVCTHYIVKSNDKTSLGTIIDKCIDNELLVSYPDKNISANPRPDRMYYINVQQTSAYKFYL